MHEDFWNKSLCIIFLWTAVRRGLQLQRSEAELDAN